MPATRKNLPDGITLIDVNGNKYTVVGDPIGFGGSSIIYRVRKNNDTEALYALKEIYPVDDISYSFFRQEDNRVVGVNASSELKLQEYRDSLTEEKQKGDSIGHNNPTVLTISDILDMNIERDLEKISLGQYALMRDITGAKTIQQILEECKENDRLYYTDEREKKPKAFTVLRIIESILMALEKVHNNGYIHGDIQPNNIVYLSADPQNNIWGAAMLLDFGSARKISEHKIGDAIYLTTEDLRGQNIYSTDGYRAPEIRSNAEIRLSPQTDIYSVGKLMNYLLNGCSTIGDFTIQANTPGARRSGYGDSGKKIEEIYKKATKNDWKKRYASASEMLAEVHALCLELQPSAYKFRNAVPSSEYKGRDKEIADIGKLFNTRNMLFLCGFGGIGKTTLAILYGQKYARKNGYEVIYTVFNNSIKETIAGLTLTGYDDRESGTQDIDTSYANKMAELRKLPSDSTLLIIDNMFSNFKTFNEIRKEAEYLDLEQCGIKTLITTRYRIKQENGGYEVKPFTTEKLLELIGKIIHPYNAELTTNEKEIYQELINCTQSNTYMITILAKTMAASNIAPIDFWRKIRTNQLEDDEFAKIEDDKTYQDGKLVALLTELFHITDISQNDKSKRVLLHALLIPESGIEKDVFLECEKREGLIDELNDLVNKSWILYDEEHDEFRLHQIVRMIVISELEISAIENIKFVKTLSDCIHENLALNDYRDCYKNSVLWIPRDISNDVECYKVIVRTIDGMYFWGRNRIRDAKDYFGSYVLDGFEKTNDIELKEKILIIWLSIDTLRKELIEYIEDICGFRDVEFCKRIYAAVYKCVRELKEYKYYESYKTFEEHLEMEHDGWLQRKIDFNIQNRLWCDGYRLAEYSTTLITERITQNLENIKTEMIYRGSEKVRSALENIYLILIKYDKDIFEKSHVLIYRKYDALLSQWHDLCKVVGKMDDICVIGVVNEKTYKLINLRKIRFERHNKKWNNVQKWKELCELLEYEAKICAYISYPQLRSAIEDDCISLPMLIGVILNAGKRYIYMRSYNSAIECLENITKITIDEEEKNCLREICGALTEIISLYNEENVIWNEIEHYFQCLYGLVCTELQENENHKTAIYKLIADIFRILGADKQAIQYYEKCLQTEGCMGICELECRKELIKKYEQQEEWKKVEKELDLVIKTKKINKTVDLWIEVARKAKLERSLKNWKQAARLYLEALTEYHNVTYFEINDIFLYEGLASCLWEQKLYDQAIDYYEEVIRVIYKQYDRTANYYAIKIIRDVLILVEGERETLRRVKYYEWIFSKFKTIPNDAYSFSIMYIELANIFENTFNGGLAQDYYKIVLEIQNKKVKKDEELLEICYKELHDYDNLKKYYDGVWQIGYESVKECPAYLVKEVAAIMEIQKLIEAVKYFYDEKKYDIAVEYYDKAKQLMNMGGTNQLMNMQQIYALNKKSDLDNAEEFLKKVEEIQVINSVESDSLL